MSEAIKVVVRVRPMSQKEKDRNCKDIVQVDEKDNRIILMKPQDTQNSKPFTYDSVFSAISTQESVYMKAAFNLVQNVLTGYNGTIFAYGQTGCGKTHSMVGNINIEEMKGIIPRSFGHILSNISESKDKEFLIRCSFIEIYNEEVRDLLAKDPKKGLQIKQSPEKGVFVKDVTFNPAKTHEELMDYMNLGNKNRSVGETAMNKDSSRSHLLFMLHLEFSELFQGQNIDDRKYIASKLNLVDLAGSQRINKTGAQGERLQEAKNINLSLSALGNVISALVDGKSHHIPYRDSKLTRLLQDSLGGNTKTVMVANCSPADYNYDQTLSTLRYASRAKFIKNKPIINQDPKDALLKEYAEQIKKLKQMISGDGGDIGKQNFMLSNDMEGRTKEIDEKEQEIQNERKEIGQLMERIRELEKGHVKGNEIKLKPELQKNIENVRASVCEAVKKVEKLDFKSQRNIDLDVIMDEEENEEIERDGVEVQRYKKLIKSLKSKSKRLEIEIKDIASENFSDKETLLDDIRQLTRQNTLLLGILSMLLNSKQLNQIKSVAETTYNQQIQQYNVPHFSILERDVFLPQIKNNSAVMNIEKELLVNRQTKYFTENQGVNSKKFSMEKVKLKQNDLNEMPLNMKKQIPDLYSKQLPSIPRQLNQIDTNRKQRKKSEELPDRKVKKLPSLPQKQKSNQTIVSEIPVPKKKQLLKPISKDDQ